MEQIGEKIKRLRLQRGLTQEELADRCELSKGFISLVERNLTSPSIATLEDILASLGSDLSAFFARTGDERVVFGDDDICVKEDVEGLKGHIRWLVPTAQKNSMEPILVEMAAGGETEMQDPHEGEEFGFVLSGTVIIHLGAKKYKANKGESFYYSASKEHYIENNTDRVAKFIWVATPPTF